MKTRFLVGALLAAACAKDVEPVAPAPDPVRAPAPVVAKPAAAPKPDTLKALKPPLSAGWEGDYNSHLDSWTFEKYTPGKNGNDPNRFYLDKFSSSAPRDAKDYAEKLKSDPNFQDMGYLFTSAEIATLPNGWLITGQQKDVSKPKDPGQPAFVVFREDLNVLCRGGTFVNVALRSEAIEGCKKL